MGTLTAEEAAAALKTAIRQHPQKFAQSLVDATLREELEISFLPFNSCVIGWPTVHLPEEVYEIHYWDEGRGLRGSELTVLVGKFLKKGSSWRATPPIIALHVLCAGADSEPTKPEG
jgi:hypothetical protein